MLGHFQLPKGTLIVNFREMENPGRVELTRDEVYLVDLNANYRDDTHDIAAILAHEICHVFLFRHGLAFSDVLDNEILTDTTAAYLGTGWLSLNAYRVTKHEERRRSFTTTEVRVETKEEALGYLTPEEFGYVVGKRELVFGEKVRGLISNSAAQSALDEGYQRARLEFQIPPLDKCTLWRRLEYYWDRRKMQTLASRSALKGLSHPLNGYRFDVNESIKVVFECPVCSQKLRLPVQKKVKARCVVCGSSLDCKT